MKASYPTTINKQPQSDYVLKAEGYLQKRITPKIRTKVKNCIIVLLLVMCDQILIQYFG